MTAQQNERRGAIQGPPKTGGERQTIFTVRVGGENIGLPIDCVRTVFRASSMTPVPLAPRRMIGLINLRGHVVSAVCMHTVLGLPLPPIPPTLMVAVEHRGDTYALAVDKVGDVLEVQEEDSVPMPGIVSPARRAVTTGVFRTKDDIIPLLNIEALLDADQEAAAA
jgi:purine-binding chemotaxis protein CheW